MFLPRNRKTKQQGRAQKNRKVVLVPVFLVQILSQKFERCVLSARNQTLQKRLLIERKYLTFHAAKFVSVAYDLNAAGLNDKRKVSFVA